MHLPPSASEPEVSLKTSQLRPSSASPRSASPQGVQPRSILRVPQSASPDNVGSPYKVRNRSVPEIMRRGGHPSHVHGARSRFVSLPVLVPEIDTERDRLLRACGQVPFLSSPCAAVSRQPAPSTVPDNINELPLAPKWPYEEVLLRLRKLLRLEGKNIKDFLDFDDIEALYANDVAERDSRERSREKVLRMRNEMETPEWPEDARVFGVSLHEAVLLAPKPIAFAGARHDVPAVLFDCVEELYRTGMYISGLFRDLPNRRRHAEMYKAYNTSPSFGLHLSLRSESAVTISALLSSFLKNLPEPLLGEPLFEPVWNWCVRPSVQREEARQAHDESEEEDARETYYRTGVRARRPSRREIAARRRTEMDEDEALAAKQVPVVQCLLRLLPTARLSTLVYICTFFSQLPLCPENGVTLDDLARMFCAPVVGGARPASRHVLLWLLKRWSLISDGLLDPDLGPDIPDPLPPRDSYDDERDESEEEGEEGDYGQDYSDRRGPHWRTHPNHSTRRQHARRSSADSPAANAPSADVQWRSTYERTFPGAMSSDRRDSMTISSSPYSTARASRRQRNPLSTNRVEPPALPPLVFASEPLATVVSESDDSPSSLRAQLACARRERDEALRIVQTLRSVLEH